MSAYYDLYETPVPEGEEPKSLHARVCSKGTISGKEFMERVFREEHMPHAMVVGIVQAITTTLGDWLAKGYTVEIEALEPLLSQNITQLQIPINNQLITIIIKSKYYRISLAISIFGCIFGCGISNTPSHEHQTKHHFCT